MHVLYLYLRNVKSIPLSSTSTYLLNKSRLEVTWFSLRGDVLIINQSNGTLQIKSETYNYKTNYNPAGLFFGLYFLICKIVYTYLLSCRISGPQRSKKISY